MIDFTPRVREQRIANLMAADVILHNLSMSNEDREGAKITGSAWRHVYRQKELYMTHALCMHCWQDIHNPDYDGWKHVDGCEFLCGENGDIAEPAMTPWRSKLEAA